MRAGEEDRSLFYSRGHGSGSLSHSGGLDWSLGEAVGEWETSGKNLASEIAHLQSKTFRGQARPQRRLGSGRWMTQIGIFSPVAGNCGGKGPGHFVPAILILPSQPATACPPPALSRSGLAWSLPVVLAGGENVGIVGFWFEVAMVSRGLRHD